MRDAIVSGVAVLVVFGVLVADLILEYLRWLSRQIDQDRHDDWIDHVRGRR